MQYWKKIPGFEKYEITDGGVIRRSGLTKKGDNYVSIVGHVDTSGYRGVQLRVGGKQYTRRVHRLVAAAFIPNLENKPEVNHLDEDKLNNNVSNLGWCTRIENLMHGTARQRITDKVSKPVNQLTMSGKFVKRWKSQAELGRAGFITTSIGQCCIGRYKHSQGFKWEFSPKKQKNKAKKLRSSSEKAN